FLLQWGTILAGAPTGSCFFLLQWGTILAGAPTGSCFSLFQWGHALKIPFLSKPVPKPSALSSYD
ncbi:MAG: hypothetical protein ACI4DN_06785, partial [Lachnospiraceae bacterium]